MLFDCYHYGSCFIAGPKHAGDAMVHWKMISDDIQSIWNRENHMNTINDVKEKFLPISACFSLLIFASGIPSIWCLTHLLFLEKLKNFLERESFPKPACKSLICKNLKIQGKREFFFPKPACKSGSKVGQVQSRRFRASLGANGQTLPYTCDWSDQYWF